MSAIHHPVLLRIHRLAERSYPDGVTNFGEVRYGNFPRSVGTLFQRAFNLCRICDEPLILCAGRAEVVVNVFEQNLLHLPPSETLRIALRDTLRFGRRRERAVDVVECRAFRLLRFAGLQAVGLDLHDEFA